MKFSKSVGIVAYGTYLPQWVVKSGQIAIAQHKEQCNSAQSLGVEQKTVADFDEDTGTLAVAAGQQAVDRYARSEKIGGLFIGSESHPYAVKPTGTVVKQALGLNDQLALADLQFACKAGTQALQIAMAYVCGELLPAVMAIGADTAQSKPGDALEFSAGSGAAAMIVGTRKVLARVIASTSYATDTPDFWRRPGQIHPSHAGRFTGKPAYFHHVIAATQQLLTEVSLQPKQIDYCVFHTPNGKFPRMVAEQLGFSQSQLSPGLVVAKIGNTYAGASMLALAAVLDQARAGQKILMTSYGSGAGADSFLFKVTPHLPKARKKWHNSIQHQINCLRPITYQQYREMSRDRH